MGLERTQKLLEICISNKNRPEVIQILGTNGKGSTSAILNKILTNSEYSVGLFTSPHLNSFRERIRVNCTPIEQKSVKDFIYQYRDAIEKIEASFFEVMTAMAFWYFKKNNVDYAIMERQDNVALLPFTGNWSDVGSWDSLASLIEERTPAPAVP